MAVIDNAVYVDGVRAVTPDDLRDTREALDARGGFAWIGLYRPDEHEMQVVAEEFGLHPLAVEDSLNGHQRAKLERYGASLFVVLRPARYLDVEEEVEFGELELFVDTDAIVAVRHAESPDLAAVRRRLEASPELLARGTMGVLYAVLDQVVDEYIPVVLGLENDVDEIETQLFEGDPAVSRRIYELSGEVMDLQRAIKPLTGMITQIRDDLEAEFGKQGGALELRRSFRDVLDHVIHATEKIDELRQTLQNALTTNATLVAQSQNERMQEQTEQSKRVAAWAAIIFAPSLVTGIYGMNFVHMPELVWPWGYPLALTAMAAFALALYLVFRSRRWL